MDTQEIIDSILSGDNDDDYRDIYEAIKTRQSMSARGKVMAFRVGDRVVFNGNARPKYLLGVEGVVKKRNETTVVVKIEGYAGKYTDSAPRCPVGMLDKVEA